MLMQFKYYIKRKSKYILRRNKLSQSRIFAVLFILTVILIFLFFFVEIRIRPLVSDLATVTAKNVGLNALNEALNEQLFSTGVKYDDLITLEKDNSGKITALKTNVLKINDIKLEITTKIIKKIANINGMYIYIPVGSIINGELFSGRGPKIKVKFMPVATTIAEYKNVFSSAGINQTRHQIIIAVTVTVTVPLPGNKSITASVTNDIPIAETVIVGVVPDQFLQIEK